MSRRDQIRMTHDELRDFLAGSQTIIINSIGPDGVPHPMPMWFGVEDDGAIVMTTFRKSQKVKNLERDPRVSLLVEDGTVYSELRGAVLYGKAELIDDTDRVLDILSTVALANQPEVEGEAQEAVRQGLLATAKKRVGIRVRPERIVSWDHRKLGGTY
jgi:PPOX class probable F420-dependent enzyme